MTARKQSVSKTSENVVNSLDQTNGSIVNVLVITNKFIEVLGIVQSKAAFERYKKEYSRDELIEIFESHSINRLLVKDLLNSNVPENLKLFNPNFDADAFLKSVITDDLKKSDQVEWVGNDIQTAKIARGLLYAGNPQLLEGVDVYGELREWEVSTPETLSLAVNTNDIHFPEEDLQKIFNLVRRKFGLFNERIAKLKKQQQDDGNLPLLSQIPK